MTKLIQTHIEVPIDYFGVVSAQLFAQLLKQDGDKRKRKTAFTEIRRMCKNFSVLPKDAEVQFISLCVDQAGQIAYRLDFTSVYPNETVENTRVND